MYGRGEIEGRERRGGLLWIIIYTSYYKILGRSNGETKMINNNGTAEVYQVMCRSMHSLLVAVIRCQRLIARCFTRNLQWNTEQVDWIKVSCLTVTVLGLMQLGLSPGSR